MSVRGGGLRCLAPKRNLLRASSCAGSIQTPRQNLIGSNHVRAAKLVMSKKNVFRPMCDGTMYQAQSGKSQNASTLLHYLHIGACLMRITGGMHSKSRAFPSRARQRSGKVNLWQGMGASRNLETGTVRMFGDTNPAPPKQPSV